MFKVDDFIKYNRLYDDCDCPSSGSGKLFKIVQIDENQATLIRIGAEYEDNLVIPIKILNQKFQYR